MIKSKAEIEEKIGNLVANFLKVQFGENVASVKTFLLGSVVTVCATNCLAPAERNFVQNQKNWNLFQELKARQFTQVESLLKKQLAEITGCEVLNIYSLVGQDGVRFEIITFSENLENRLLDNRPHAMFHRRDEIRQP